MNSHRFEHAFTVRLHDIDAAGVMFFAHYLRHAHDAYETFMRRNGWDLAELIDSRRMLPLVHSHADFLLPVKHGERLTIQLRVERLGNSSFSLGYLVRNERNEECARLGTTHVMLSPDDRQPMPLPQALREVLNEFVA